MFAVRVRFDFALLLSLLIFAPSHILGQSIGGTFLGLVKDQTGPVPQAEVRITNLDTGQARFVLTDDQGRYELREIPPGLYQLMISKDGYKTITSPSSQGIRLSVAQVARVDDITLTVAPLSNVAVEVKSTDVAMPDFNRPTLSTAFSAEQVEELPLSARDVNNLAPLAPGVASVSSYSFANTLVPFTVNGSRGRDNNFVVDSVDNNEPLFGGAATQFSNSDLFSEFRILTGQFQAEYGRNSGGIVNVITKQGGRDFHGALSWYGQNDALNAMTKVEKQSQLDKPARFYENQLGGAVGGPIKADSTWFFLSYQWDRARNDLTSEYPVVATLPTLDGFAELTDLQNSMPTPSASLARLLADPTVREFSPLGIPCTVLPGADEKCPQGSWLGPTAVVPIATYILPRANVFDVRDHQASARVDHIMGQRDTVSGRYLFDDLRTPAAPLASTADVAFLDLGLLPRWREILALRTQNAGAFWTHAFDRSLNELRISYSRIASQQGALNVDEADRDLPATTIIDGELFGPGTGVVPSTRFPAAGDIITLGSDTRTTRFISDLYQLQENFSLTTGRHRLKFGANLVDTRSGIQDMPDDLGHDYYDFVEPLVGFIFNGVTDATQRFGNFAGKGGEVLPLRELAQYYFVQDDIRLGNSLTLNLGLRYENYGQAFNRIVDLNSTGPSKLNRVNTNFAPRVGFAWGLGNRTVIRGGYGIFYDPVFFNIYLLTWQGGPLSAYANTGEHRMSGPSPNGFPNAPIDSSVLALTMPFCGITSPLGVGFADTFADCTTSNEVSKHLINPFVHSASLSLQRQLGHDLLVEATYSDSRGTHLFQRLDFLQQDPETTTLTNGALSHFNALELSATKRMRSAGFWNGIALTVAYTWSYMTDTASEIFGPPSLNAVSTCLTASPAQQGPPNESNLCEPRENFTPFSQDPNNPRNAERGNSSFDRRQRIALSYLWALPSPSGALVRPIFGGWEINGVFVAQSGQPFSPINSVVPNSNGSCDTDFDIRPSIGNPHAPANSVAVLTNCSDVTQGYVDPSTGNPIDPSTVRFVQVPNGVSPGQTFTADGKSFIANDAGRNILTGPGIANWDLSAAKNFSIRERYGLRIRFDFFDLLNHASATSLAGNPYIASAQPVDAYAFDPIAIPARVSGLTPENGIDAAEGGKSTFLQNTFVTTNSRRIQFSLKLSF